MSASTKNNSIKTAKELETDVLYQKLGDQWFAFSLIEDEMFMAPVSETAIAQIKKDHEAA